MKLQITKNLAKGIYSTKMELIEISTVDQDLLDDRAGFVELNVGGNVVVKEMADDGQGGQVEKEVILLKQGDDFIKFAEGLPLVRTFSIAQYGDEKAQKIAEAYTEMMEKRITETVDEMKTKGDTFSGVTQIIL